MEIYLASANVDEIKKIQTLPVKGALTNPNIVLKEKRNFADLVTEIDSIGSLPFGLQIASTEKEEMIKEVELFRSLVRKRVLHVKIPYCRDAFEIIPQLKNAGLLLNLTAISTLAQAGIALESPIDYLSIYVGRVSDAGGDGFKLIREVKEFADKNEKKTKIVAASIRNITQLEEVMKAGADAVAIPYALLMESLNSSTTDLSTSGFQQDWDKIDRS